MFFAEDGLIKLSALLLAVLSFYAIQGAISFEVSYDIPLDVKVEKGIAILAQDTRTVHVTFRGAQEDIRLLDQTQIRAVARPRVGNAAGLRVPVGPRDIEGISGVRVVGVRPGSVNLTFDHEVEKKVAVAKPKTIGSPLIGKARIEYEPRFVTIRGPKQRLNDINVIDVEPIDVDGRVESFSKRVRALSPADTWISQIAPSEISVNVAIVTESAAREWTNITVLAVVQPGRPADVRFEPEKVNVSLQGMPETLENIADEAIKVFVDCSGLNDEATYELPARVHLPAGMDVAATVVPSVVKVVISLNRP